MPDHKSFMRRALALSEEALSKPGSAPFGCVIVRDGEIVGEGLNHAAARHDPTSHGEVEAIRDACARLGTLTLENCDLYTSCEPCALCVATMQLVGIRKLYYAASLKQSGAALAAAYRPAIDVAALRKEAGSSLETRGSPSEQMLDAESVSILERWAAAAGAPGGAAV